MAHSIVINPKCLVCVSRNISQHCAQPSLTPVKQPVSCITSQQVPPARQSSQWSPSSQCVYWPDKGATSRWTSENCASVHPIISLSLSLCVCVCVCVAMCMTKSPHTGQKDGAGERGRKRSTEGERKREEGHGTRVNVCTYCHNVVHLQGGHNLHAVHSIGSEPAGPAAPQLRPSHLPPQEAPSSPSSLVACLLGACQKGLLLAMDLCAQAQF
jgi:hypothetical protein